LVYIVFSAFAPDLGRMSSYDYFQMGVSVEQAELRPGDLVFFTTYAPGASHVGIYAGERKFIHAASSTQQVMISTLDESYYVTRYIGARRIVAAAASVTP
jgi:cell wall-associated NlpC family hydrolase